MILVARTEGLLADAEALTPAIDRLVAFAEAGADCLYAPGVKKKDDIAAMVRAVAPKPLNVLMFGPGLSVAELADLGVRRISVGGALARVAWGAMLSVAEQMKCGLFAGLRARDPRVSTIFSQALPARPGSVAGVIGQARFQARRPGGIDGKTGAETRAGRQRPVPAFLWRKDDVADLGGDQRYAFDRTAPGLPSRSRIRRNSWKWPKSVAGGVGTPWVWTVGPGDRP